MELPRELVETLTYVVPALVIDAALLAVMVRGLARAGWAGFGVRAALGVVILVALCVAAMAALNPAVQADIAACEAADSYDCEDATLVLVIPILIALFAIAFWLVAVTVVRIATRGRRRSNP